MRYLTKLFTTKPTNSGDIEEHINKLVSIHNEIQDIQTLVPDALFASAILKLLPPSYNPLVQTFSRKDCMTLKSGDVITEVILEYQQRINRDGLVALVVEPNIPRSRANNECQYCHQRGHWLRECPTLAANGGPRPRPNKGSGGGNRNGGGEKANVAEMETGKTETANLVAGYSDLKGDVLEYTFIAGKQAHVARSGGERWIGDSGTGVHVVTNCDLFHLYHDTPGTLDGVGSQPILGHGDVKVIMHGPDGDSHITLRDTVHVAGLLYNPISLAHITGNHIKMTLTHTLTIHDRTSGRIIGSGTHKGNLYYVNATGVCTTKAFAAISAWDLHEALGHIGAESIHQLATGMVDGLRISGPIPDKFNCTQCIQGKHARTTQPKKSTREITEIGEVIVLGVMGGGTNLPVGLGGICYVVTFMDMQS
jgi:hypothetical protein